MFKLNKWFLLGISLSILNVLDLASTLYLINNHLGREANPIAAYLLQYGDWALGVAKLIAIFTIMWLSIRANTFKSAKIILILFNLVYVAVVANNLWLLFRFRFPGIFH